MIIGSLAEWVGAIATFGATIVALWLGLRTDTRTEAQNTLKKFARDQLLELERWQIGLQKTGPRSDSADSAHTEDRTNAAALVLATNELLPVQRALVLRRLRRIFGKENLQVAVAFAAGTSDPMMVLVRELSGQHRGLPIGALTSSLLHRGLSQESAQSEETQKLMKELTKLNWLR